MWRRTLRRAASGIAAPLRHVEDDFRQRFAIHAMHLFWSGSVGSSVRDGSVARGCAALNAASLAASIVRARCSRERTVPMAQPNASAASAYVNSSRSHRTTTSRYRTGRARTARRSIATRSLRASSPRGIGVHHRLRLFAAGLVVQALPLAVALEPLPDAVPRDPAQPGGHGRTARLVPPASRITIRNTSCVTSSATATAPLMCRAKR